MNVIDFINPLEQFPDDAEIVGTHTKVEWTIPIVEYDKDVNKVYIF